MNFYPVTRFLVTPLLVTALLCLVTPHQKLLVCDAGQNAVDTEEAKCLWKNPQHQNLTKQKH